MILKNILQNNNIWRNGKQLVKPTYFNVISKIKPSILWIGCVDNRVDPVQLTGKENGELLVLRNIANIVDNKDSSLNAFLSYGINHLNIKDIILCGHSDCGGIKHYLNNNDNNECSVGCWTNKLAKVSKDKKLDIMTFTKMNILQQRDHLLENSIIGKKIDIHTILYYVENGTIEKI